MPKTIVPENSMNAGFTKVIPFPDQSGSVPDRPGPAISECLQTIKRLISKHAAIHASRHVAVVVHHGKAVFQFCFLIEPVIRSRRNNRFPEISEFNEPAFTGGIIPVDPEAPFIFGKTGLQVCSFIPDIV